MASRIQSLGITLQTNTSVSPKSLVSGGNRQHLMEHCPGSPSPLLQALGGTKKQKNWRETERGEAERSVKEESERERLDKMNYAKLSEAAIVGGAGCVEESQPWSPQAPSTALTTPRGWEPSDLCSGKRPTTRWGGLGGVEGPARPLGDRWIVLEGHTRNDKYALYYHYLQRSPTGRSELIRTAALRKYNYRTKAWWIVATSALWSAVATLVLLCVLK